MTEKIILATGVTLLALHNPVELAHRSIALRPPVFALRLDESQEVDRTALIAAGRRRHVELRGRQDLAGK